MRSPARMLRPSERLRPRDLSPVTPQERFRRLIAREGAISVARYMGESNALYYASRDPLGAAGDFVTAPDIHQMFGELVGAWIADLWVRAGRPPTAYVELGPGRGTLARDALRVLSKAGWDGEVHFVEGSPVLRKAQARQVGRAQFHEDPSRLPDDVALIVIANEFLDALAVRQWVRTPDGWRERMVALDEDRFVFAAGSQPMDAVVPPHLREAAPGTILETSPASVVLVDAVARRVAHQGGAALFIDYGHLAPRKGSTLQAVRDHAKVDPLAFPGEADLTAHVDFPALAGVARAAGAGWLSATTQGAWLTALGIGERARQLAAAGDDAAQAGLNRLVQADAMGDLFKVMAFGSRNWPPGAGFA